MKKTDEEPAASVPVEYQRAMDETADEITRFTGGENTYLVWFSNTHPVHFAQFEKFLMVIDSAAGVLPFPMFQTLLGVYLAEHKHLHTMWTVREQLRLLSTPIGPWSM
jgi:hypothetical protein